MGKAKYKGSTVFIVVLNFRMQYAIISMEEELFKGFKVELHELSNIKIDNRNE